MKIGTVLTATDLTPLYADFIPMFIKAWNKIIPSADVKIIMVADSIPEKYKAYESNIVLFKPIEGIKTPFIAQCIRLLYTREITRDEGVLITDMDMIPLSNSYYTESIRDYDNSYFLIYGKDGKGVHNGNINAQPPEQIWIPHNVACPNIWREIFGTEDTTIMLKKWYEESIKISSEYNGRPGFNGWYSDQELLTKYVNAYKGNKKAVGFSSQSSRLDRTHTDAFKDLDTLRKDIKNGKYYDYHALRPYEEHKGINDYILDSINIYTGGKRKKRKTIKKKYKKKVTRRKIKGGTNSKYLNCKYLTTYNIKEACENMEGVIYVDVNFLNDFKIPTKPFVLVTGASDYTIPDTFMDKANEILNSSNLVHWYSQNVSKTDNSRLTGYPIGIDYHTTANTQEPIDQENDLLRIKNSAKPFYERDIKIYCNFLQSIRGKYGEKDRKEVLEQIPNELLIKEEYTIPRNDTWKRMSENAFVASPHGNGLDCHRTWEALALDCIPIVKTSSLDIMYTDLPVLIVNKWSDITKELLTNTIEDYKNKKFNMDKLTITYWVNHIRNSVVRSGGNKTNAIAVCSNKAYLDKAKKTIDEIRTKGQWTGDLVFFHDNELVSDNELKDLKEKYNLILKEFSKIDTSKVENEIDTNPNSKYKRLRGKMFQYFKFNIFNTYFKQWNNVLYIDCGMHIFNPLQRFFNLDIKGKLLANSDSQPTYEWNLETQFDLNTQYGEKLKKEYNLKKNDYFQSGVLLFDTHIIEDDTVSKLIELMNTYPISTGDQGIMNLYFLNMKNLWTPLPLKNSTGLLYDYDERNNKKEDYIMIKYPKS